MKPSFILLFFLLINLPMHTHGQSVDGEVENLFMKFEQADGRERVNAANHLFLTLDHEQITDSLIHFTTHVRRQQLDMHVYYWMGVYAVTNARYEEAVMYDDRALALAVKTGDGTMQSELLNEKAVALFRLSDFAQALSAAKACMESCRHSDDIDLKCRVQNTIAAIYVATRQPASALPYNQRSIELAQQLGDSILLGTRYGAKAEIYHSMGEEAQAVHCAQMALQIDSLRGDTVAMAVRRVQMAAAVVAQGDTVQARQLLEIALPYLRDARRRPSLAIALTQMGEILVGQGQEAKAAEYFSEALSLARVSGNRYHEVRAHHGLYLALNRANPALSLTHLNAYAALKDSIYSDEMKAIMAGYDAQLRNAELAEEKTRLMERVRSITLASIVVLLVLLVALAVLFYAYRQQRRVALYLQRQTGPQADVEAEEAKDKDDTLSIENQELLNRINKAIYRLMAKGTPDVESLAAEMTMSNSSLRRKLFSITGFTPANYILRLRLDKACQLLRSDVTLPIGDIATRCGFDSSANFSRAFRQIYNQTPSDYRRCLGS